MAQDCHCRPEGRVALGLVTRADMSVLADPVDLAVVKVVVKVVVVAVCQSSWYQVVEESSLEENALDVMPSARTAY